MADFYPVLARAVSRLPIDSVQARKELYEHARRVVFEQLRTQDPPRSGREIIVEQAALENAIQKVEIESRSPKAPILNGAPPVRSSANRAAAANGGVQTKTGPKSVNGISRQVQPGVKPEAHTAETKERRESPSPARVAINETNAAVAPSSPIAAGARQAANATAEFDGMLHSLGSMLLGTAFIVAMMAILGLIYIHALTLVSPDVIGYPTLFVVVATVLSVLLLVTIFRKASIEGAVGALLRLFYPAIRRLLDFPMTIKNWERTLNRRMPAWALWTQTPPRIRSR